MKAASLGACAAFSCEQVLREVEALAPATGMWSGRVTVQSPGRVGGSGFDPAHLFGGMNMKYCACQER